MGRCQSWKPLEGSTGTGDTGPGGRARAWEPCTNKVPKGAYRCSECLSELVSHPDPVVRRWMAEEVGQSTEILELLSTDLDEFRVASVARQKLSLSHK